MKLKRISKKPLKPSMITAEIVGGKLVISGEGIYFAKKWNDAEKAACTTPNRVFWDIKKKDK